MTSSGRTLIVDGSTPHLVNLLGPRPSGQVRQAIVLLQAFDELTHQPVQVPVTVSTTTAGLTGHSAQDGVCGLVGVPARAFPDLATTGHSVDVQVTAVGYLPWKQTVTFTTQAGFPGSFAGKSLGRIDLHRRGALIDVRTFQLTPQGASVPAGLAVVRVSGVWRTIADLSQPAQPPDMMGTPLGTSQPWPVGTDLDSVSLVPVVEPPRVLATSAAPGDASVKVDRVGALVAGDLIGVDLADPFRLEYLPVLAAVASVDPESPAQLTLGGQVRVAHALGVAVPRVNAPAPSPPDTTTTDAADLGDQTVFVASTAPFSGVEILRASGGALDDEYLDARLYRVQATVDGLARLPPISRVAAVEITATLGALSAVTRLSLDYLIPVNTLALTLH